MEIQDEKSHIDNEGRFLSCPFCGYPEKQPKVKRGVSCELALTCSNLAGCALHGRYFYYKKWQTRY